MAIPENVLQIFEQLDANNSGYIELDEMEAFASNMGLDSLELMQQLDVDGDGRVSLDDFAACAASLGLAPPPAAVAATPTFEVTDESHDSTSALAAKALRLFDQLDADHSGAIDEEELETVLAGMGLTDAATRKRQTRVLMAKLDDNGDGEVSRDEFIAAASDPMFAALFASMPDEETHAASASAAAAAASTPERDELCARIDSLFDRLDVDKSGALSLPEIETLLFNLGMLDLAERKQRARVILADLDEDMSGEVDKDEFLVAARRGDFDELLHGNAGEHASVAVVVPSGEHESFEGNTKESTVSQRLHARRMDRASHASRYESVMHKKTKRNVSLVVPNHERSGSHSGGEQSGGELSGGEEKGFARSKSGRRVSSKLGLTPEKTKHLWDIFQVADSDHTGTICAKELMAILSDESLTGHKLAYLSEEYVNDIMKSIDTSGDGELDFDEFLQAFQDILTDSGDVAKKQKKSLQSAENMALAAEISRLRDALTESERTVFESKLQFQREIDELHSSLDHTHDQMQAEQDKSAKESRELQQQVKGLKEELKISQAANESLHADMDALKAETKRLQFRTRTGSVFGEFDSANDLARELSRLREVHTKLQDSAALEAARAHDREVELHATVQSLEARLAKFERMAQLHEMDDDDVRHEAADRDHLERNASLGESIGSSLGGVMELSASLDAAQAALRTAEAENAELRKQLEASSRAVEAGSVTAASLRAAEDTIADLTTKLQDASARADHESKLNAQAKQQHDIYDEEIDTLNTQNAELQRELSTARAKVQRNDVLTRELAASQNELEHVRADATASAAKVGALESSLALSSADLAKARQKVTTLTEENEKLRLTATTAERSLQTAQGERDLVNTRLGEAVKQLKTQADDLAAARQRAEELEEKQRTQETVVHSVNVGASAPAAGTGPQFVAAETIKAEMDALQRELQESHEELRAMKRKDRQSYSVIDAMSVENAQLKREISELETELAALAGAKDAESKVADLQSRLAAANSLLETTQTASAGVQTQLKGSQEHVAALEQEIARLRDAGSTSEAQVRAQLNDATVSLTRVTAEKDALLVQVTVLRGQLAALQAELDKVTAKVAAQEAGDLTARAELTRAQAEAAALKQSLSQREAELAAAKRESAFHAANLVAAQNEHSNRAVPPPVVLSTSSAVTAAQAAATEQKMAQLATELVAAQASAAAMARRRALAEAQLAAVQQREAADVDALHRLLQLATDGLEEARAELAQRDQRTAATHTVLSADDIVAAALLYHENTVLQRRLERGDFEAAADDDNDDDDEEEGYDDSTGDEEYTDESDYDDADDSSSDEPAPARVLPVPGGTNVSGANVSGDARQFVQLEGWKTGTYQAPPTVDAAGNALRNFPARVGPSHLAERAGLVGVSAWLQLSARGIALVDAQGRRRLAFWGLTEIRRFGKTQGLFSLEISNADKSTSGVMYLATMHMNHLFGYLQELLA